MEYNPEQILDMLERCSKCITKDPEKYIFWKSDAQCFAAYYNLANEEAKKIADNLYNKNKINEILDYADKTNFTDFEENYKKITNYEKPDDSWRLSAWGCANNYDNARETTKQKLISKYGKTFIDKVMQYREEMHKRRNESFEAQFCKDIPDDINPIMPLLDDEKGIIFYSKKKRKLYLFDLMPLKISMLISNKTKIKNHTNKLQIELSWQEETDIFTPEREYIQTIFIPLENKLILKSTHEKDIYQGAVIMEYVRTDITKNTETIEKINTKLKAFDNEYFKKENKDFLETKNYLKTKLGIKNVFN